MADNIMDNETLKVWIRNKNTQNILNKAEYKRERVYNIKDDNERHEQHGNRGNPQQQQCHMQ